MVEGVGLDHCGDWHAHGIASGARGAGHWMGERQKESDMAMAQTRED